MRKHFRNVLLILIVLLPFSAANASFKIDLNGSWDFKMDPNHVGEAERWYEGGTAYDMKMPVPGSWNAGGAGGESNNLFHSYFGVAWYHRRIGVFRSWRGGMLRLNFGGAHRYVKAWANGRPIGEHVAYPVPFSFSFMLPEDQQSVDLVIRVDSRRNGDIDPLCGCFDLMDMGPMEWGGLYGGVDLEVSPSSSITNVEVVPRIATGEAVVTTKTAWMTEAGPFFDVLVGIYDAKGKLAASARAPASWKPTVMTFKIPNVQLWSPQHPYLYTVKAKLIGYRTRLHRGMSQPHEPAEEIELDSYTDRFGMREISISGKQFLLNGKPIFLRGYGDDCIFPNTVCPPADKQEYLRRFKIAKAYGFNYVRHHSWFPCKEYFDAADELGIMLQPEFPIAYDVFFDIGTREKRNLYLQTWRDLIQANWNHPSIVTWCMGNELSGYHPITPETYSEMSGDRSMESRMYRMAKEIDPTRLVIDTDGIDMPGPGDSVRPTLDFLTPVFAELRLFGLNDNKYPLDLKPSKPILIHEMGNFATLPALSQIDLFKNGVRPYWLHALRDLIDKRGVQKAYPQWVAISNKLQALALKANTEAARRSPDISGYHQWLLQDYWNGSNGVLDMFYRTKGISAAQYRKFNSPTVLLMDCPRRSFRSGEIATITALASRYEDAPSRNAVLKWQLRAGKSVAAAGRLSGLRVNSTGVQPLGAMKIRLPLVKTARKLTFTVELTDKNGRWVNDWDLWVYPKDRLKRGKQTICCDGSRRVRRLYPWMGKATDVSRCDLLITSQMTPEQLGYIERGGRVPLLDAKTAFPSLPSSFKPCWWIGDRDDESQNVGTVVNSGHPALLGMPNDGWCDLSFADLLTDSTVVLLDELPAKVSPIIRSLDVHSKLRNKASLFEVKVGCGKLLACGMNFSAGLYKRDPAAEFLLDRLIRYAAGPSFRPSASLPAEYLRKKVAPEQPRPALQPERAPRANGFARLTVNAGEEVYNRSYRDPSRRGWLVRPTDGKQKVEWITAPVRFKKPGRVSLVWTAGMGYRSEPDGLFTIYLNGKALGPFDLANETHRWVSPDGKIELFFNVKERDREDALGVMYLTLPTSMLKNNAPTRLAVSGSNSKSYRWFMVFDYRDTVEYEE